MGSQALVNLLARCVTKAAGVLLVLAIGAILADYVRILLQRRRLPPGPFPWPLVGNHFQVPQPRPWIAWEQWALEHNAPMMTLWIGRHPRIIINDAWVASDLMEKRADIWSSRPRIIAMGDAINATNTNQTTLVYGDRWRLHRRLMVSITMTLVSRHCWADRRSTPLWALKQCVGIARRKQMNQKCSSETS